MLPVTPLRINSGRTILLRVILVSCDFGVYHKMYTWFGFFSFIAFFIRFYFIYLKFMLRFAMKWNTLRKTDIMAVKKRYESLDASIRISRRRRISQNQLFFTFILLL